LTLTDSSGLYTSQLESLEAILDTTQTLYDTTQTDFSQQLQKAELAIADLQAQLIQTEQDLAIILTPLPSLPPTPAIPAEE
jgi:septal ring factor EnvC (AmiA/AmiB activator)